ncbi:hypothetical protein D3C81_304920 [compost metagenome]
MSSEAYVYAIPKENAEKDPCIKPGLEGKPIDDLCCTLGEAEGFKIFWISPTSGHTMEALQKHLPLVWDTHHAYLVTKEEFLLFLNTCREVAKRDQFDQLDYLLKEYDEFERKLDEFDFEKNVLFMHEY